MTFELAQLSGGRRAVRLPLSPRRAEMALKALQEWREPAAGGREQRWYAISDAAAGPAQVHILDEIGWWGITAQEFVDDISKIPGDLEVHISSPGGLASDGLAIYNALASRPGSVATVADGIVASAASIIMMAGQPRTMSPGSMLMIHDASGLCIGNEADMVETARVLGKLSDSIAGIYAAHSSTPAAGWRAAMRGEGWYTAQEAVDAGLADNLAERAAGGGDSQAAWDTQIFDRWQQPRDDGAAVDESAWDASKAWANGAASDDPAAFYNAICAGKKAGDPATQAAHALPHHYHPGDPPNRHGVSAARGRIDSTEGLTNKAAAQAHLDAHQSAIDSSGGTDHYDLDQLMALKEAFAK